MGGQTGLNLAVELAEAGILEQHGVQLIGASLRAIKVAEDRLLFKDACRKIGLDVPASALVNNVPEAMRLADEIGYPVVIRPSFTLGGTGGSHRLQPRRVRRKYRRWRWTPARCTKC